MELHLEPATTALVVIDLQRGIVANPATPHGPKEVVARTARMVKAFRAAGGTVVLVHVTRSRDGRDGLKPITDASGPVGRISGSPLPTDWSEIVPELEPEKADVVIAKRQWGAFYGTELDLQLRRRGVGTIVLCGISTNVGVESTARDAFDAATSRYSSRTRCRLVRQRNTPRPYPRSFRASVGSAPPRMSSRL